MQFNKIINKYLKEEITSREDRIRAMDILVPGAPVKIDKSSFDRPLTDEELKMLSKIENGEMEIEVEYEGNTYSVVVDDDYPYSVVSIVGNIGDAETDEDYIVRITKDNLPEAFSIIGGLAQEQAEEEHGSYPRDEERDWDDIGD